MARKYIVASVAIVRITAENLNTLIFRKVHQATTRNADRSKWFPRSVVPRILCRRLEQARLLTERGGDRIRRHSDPELWNYEARIESVERDRVLWEFKVTNRVGKG